MEKQVDGGAVVEAVVFFDEELSFGDCSPDEAADVSKKDDGPRAMTDEERLNAAYGVFCRYAQNRSGQYPDTIVRDLCLAGSPVQGREGILKLCDLFRAHLDFKEEDRRFVFSFKDEELPKVAAPRFKGYVVAAVGLVVFGFFSLVAVAMVGALSVDRQEAQPVVATVPPVDREIASPPPLPSAAKDDIATLDELIEKGSFSQALSFIRSQDHGLSVEATKSAKAKIDRLVITKSDSLQRSIDELLGRGKYQEAFELEQHFDKDVFRLAGGGTAQRLRQRLITDWVRSYKGWYSKEEAVESVTSEIQRILGSRSYRVAEGDGGVFYLEYGPIKDGV